MIVDNPARRTYTHEERYERACLRAAMHIRGLWEEKGRSNSRLLEGLFLPDEFTVVGRSLNYLGTGRREHVIPCKVVIEECHEMLACGKSDDEIATFIRDHVKVVLISKEEQERLDGREHGLRQIMPKEWVLGGDIFARLNAANIKWTRTAPE
ncbi:hypothetical protein [Asticcacaulis sp. EMRT-3]|uniref:hypothetical protein n=1 Tax=Asticcacaulis sp. EMRT-3 TaxID=3040349 RepID=UPI0024AFEB78|nr:hypothetical protein [Asticcacaulis sp. EMRT-3]MDI7775151.1 hypothetical protein [Asticcacaulis sp. EMRT-3]